MKKLNEQEKKFIKAKLDKTLKISAKRKENKEKLIEDILDMFQGDIYNYEEVMLDLCKESLQKLTQKQLKSWL